MERIIFCASMCAVSSACGFLCARAAGRRCGAENVRIAEMICALIAPLLAAFLCLRFADPGRVTRGMLIILVLIYASVSDAFSRECPDSVHACLLLCAFAGRSMPDVTGALFSLLPVILMLAVSLALPPDRRPGGADIKICAAYAAAAGSAGTAGMALGMLSGAIGGYAFNRIRREPGGAFPLIPFLGAGFAAALFI